MLSTRWRGLSHRGFSLVDLGGIVVVCGLVAVLLLAAGAESRRQASLGGCIQKLRQFGVATGAYADDNAGMIWSFSWRQGESHSQWNDLNNASSDLKAAANQTIDLIRRRGDPEFPFIPNWIPHVMYSPLVLSDYWNGSLPTETVLCPDDAPRHCWQADPAGFCDCPQHPYCNAKWPYSSSYEMGPAFYSQDGGVWQSSSNNGYGVDGDLPMGRRLVFEVDYPSQKAMMWESTARHFGRRLMHHAYKEARLPILFADSSVRVKATGDSNEGWIPREPGLPLPTRYRYGGDWEASTLSGEVIDVVTGHYRWTRGGLAGRDFGGPEIWP